MKLYDITQVTSRQIQSLDEILLKANKKHKNNDPGGIMIYQLKKYIEELHKNITKCFKDNLPKDLETLLDKIDLPSV